MEFRKLIIPLLVITALIPISSAQITIDGDDSDWMAIEGTLLEPFKYDVADPTRDLVWFDPGTSTVYTVDYASGFDLEMGSIYIDVSGYPVINLYFKIVTNGTIGDATGDGDPKFGTRNVYPSSPEIIVEGGPYNTGGDPESGSQFDVGSTEIYRIMFDYNGNGVMNEAIIFGDKDQLMWESTGTSTGLSYAYSGRILEIGAMDVGSHSANLGNLLFRYDMQSGSMADYWSEDYLPNLTVHPPVVDFDVTPSCQGSAEFTSHSSGDSPVVWYEWDFGDGNMDIGPNVTTSHQYDISGGIYTYTVTLKVTNLWGLTDEISKQVTVGKGKISVDAGTDETILIGECKILGGSPTASGGETPYIYVWTPSTGLNDSNIANPTACPGTTTIYTVSVKDGNGYQDKETCWDSDQVTVTVVGPGISLMKLCPPSPVEVGDVLNYEYTVTNTGNVPLKNVQLTDNKIGSLTYVSGDMNNNDWLDLTEVWKYEGTYTVINELPITNTATVTAEDELGNEVSAIDSCTVSFEVPALSTIGLIVLSGLLGIIAIFRISKKE
jgi:uncharacterized repeat protein (TIGR01451 family)